MPLRLAVALVAFAYGLGRLLVRRQVAGWTLYMPCRTKVREMSPPSSWKPLPAEAQQAMSGLDSSPLRAVVPVVASVEADGLTVEGIALEIRELGMRVSLTARWTPEPEAPPPRQIALGPVRAFRHPRPGPFPEPILEVTDDLGTTYHVGPGASGGGWHGAYRWEVHVVPRPPTATREVRVILRRIVWRDFSAGGQITATREGPWAFAVTMPESPVP